MQSITHSLYHTLKGTELRANQGPVCVSKEVKEHDNVSKDVKE